MYIKNFRRYWKEQLTHAAVGLAAGYLLASGYAAAGGGILALVITRQGLEFAKRRDTPGIDLAYHLGGCVFGVGLAILARGVLSNG